MTGRPLAERRTRSILASPVLVSIVLVSITTLIGLPLRGLALEPSPDSTPFVEASQDGSDSSSRGEADRQVRLAQALERYSSALVESDRDARLADFAWAERAFTSLASDGVDTPALWTNLGNAALQAQHPGQAVLAYQRALRLDPDDAKARQNLNHVRSGLPSWVPHPEISDAAQSFSLVEISSATRSLMAAICFLAMAVFVAASVRRRQGAWRGLAMLAGIGWVVALASTFAQDPSNDRILAVTISEESFARSADSSRSSLAYPEPLPPGVEVDLLEDRGDWVRARLANGRDVWLGASNVALVSQSAD